MVRLAVVDCGRCADERLPAQKVGEVYRIGPRVNWSAYDPTWRRAVRRSFGEDVVRTRVRAGKTIAFDAVSDFRPPERLPAFCRRHGVGSVSTADVTAERGRFAVPFTAHA